MMIIAFSGKAGSGKDTAADVLVKRHGFKKIAFADPLKALCAPVFNIPIEIFNDRELKDKEFDSKLMLDFHHIDKMREIINNDWGFEIDYQTRDDMEDDFGREFTTPRKLMQFIGTDFIRRYVGDEVFTILLISRLITIEGPVVISDCRFEVVS